MNIFLLCPVYPPEHCAAGVNIAELAEDLAKVGHSVTVITGWPSHPAGKLYDGWHARFRSVEQVREGYRLIRCLHSFVSRRGIPSKLWYYFTYTVSTFIAGLMAGKADVVLFCSLPLFNGANLLLARLKGAQSLYWIHDVHPETSRNAGMIREGSLTYRLSLALDRFVCRHSTQVATLTDAMRETLLKRGLDPAKVILMRHWVDPQKISPRSRDNPWRREQAIDLGKFVVLHAGTMGYISGAEVIVDAAQRLRQRQDILFLIVGDGPLKQRLMDTARELGLPNVKFLPFQPAEVLADVQATGDVGLVTLLPETGETSIPSKMHGYTAAARPVIASVAPDCPTARMVRDGQFGMVCPSQDASALADAIAHLADHRDVAQQMGQCARRAFLSTFDRTECVNEALGILLALAPA